MGGDVGEARMKGQTRGLSARLRPDSARGHAPRLLGPAHAGPCGSCREQGKEFTASHTAWRRSSRDRKSTRLNSSHPSISYAVFCLKKKKKKKNKNKQK